MAIDPLRRVPGKSATKETQVYRDEPLLLPSTIAPQMEHPPKRSILCWPRRIQWYLVYCHCRPKPGPPRLPDGPREELIKSNSVLGSMMRRATTPYAEVSLRNSGLAATSTFALSWVCWKQKIQSKTGVPVHQNLEKVSSNVQDSIEVSARCFVAGEKNTFWNASSTTQRREMCRISGTSRLGWT